MSSFAPAGKRKREESLNYPPGTEFFPGIHVVCLGGGDSKGQASLQMGCFSATLMRDMASWAREGYIASLSHPQGLDPADG